MKEIFYNFLGFNSDLFIFLNNYTNIGIVPVVLQAISSIFFIGNFAIYYLLTCIYFYFRIRKFSNSQSYFFYIYNELIRIGICYSVLGLSYAALKFSINMPRPFCSLSAADFNTIVNISEERCLSSFPSAHTGLSIMIAYFIWPHINNFYKVLTSLIVIAVALARITLAMHYPADILYSALITILIIMISNLIFKHLKKSLIERVGKITSKLLFS